MDLSEASIEDLMAEVQRRLDCQNKPEKRVILVGECRFPSSWVSSAHACLTAYLCSKLHSLCFQNFASAERHVLCPREFTICGQHCAVAQGHRAVVKERNRQ